MTQKRIAIVPGDGIGIDVTAEAIKVIEACSSVTGRKLDMVHYDYGADKYLKTGISMPPGGYADLAKYDAIFMGALSVISLPGSEPLRSEGPTLATIAHLPEHPLVSARDEEVPTHRIELCRLKPCRRRIRGSENCPD